MVVGDFKGHSRDVVKEFVPSFMSADDNAPDNMWYRLADWDIMAGEIITKAQHIYAIMWKVFKGNYHDLYHCYMINFRSDLSTLNSTNATYIHKLLLKSTMELKKFHLN